MVLAAIGVAAVGLARLGVTYSKLRSFNHSLPLLALAMEPDQGWIDAHLIDFELRRRILNGEFDGGETLSNAVAMIAIPELREKAKKRADWLLDGLVDINSGNSYNPLHIEIGGNNVSSVEYLLQRGADPFLKVGPDPEYQVDAFEFAEIVQSEFPEKDMSAVFEALNRHAADGRPDALD